MNRGNQYSLEAFGRQTLGPVFATFGLLLLLQARERNLHHLAFIARDGLFLRQVTSQLSQALCWPDTPRLSDIHLSRLSTSLAGCGGLDEPAFEEAKGVTGGDFTLESFFTYFGLDVHSLTPLISPMGYAPDTSLEHFQDLAPLLQSPALSDTVRQLQLDRRTLLKRYLQEADVFSASNAALVDIGWRGTIPVALDHAFFGDPNYRPQPFLYLGYWHELGCRPLASDRISGLLADHRRNKTLAEGAAYYVSLLLEAVCRPSQGPTMGYGISGEHVVPLIAAFTPTELEANAQEHSEAIRRGILEGVSHLGQRWRSAPPVTGALRQKTQSLLRQLAFFPDRGAISVAQTLCHTESHHSRWAMPLIPQSPPRPCRQPRAWLAGLTAPWRSGYVAASGGPLAAWMFFLLEATLLALPMRGRQVLRRLALSLAGKRP